MSLFAIALGLSVLGGLGGLLVASGILLINDSARSRLIPWLVSYAVGALLGVSMLAILPETLEQPPAPRVFGTLLGLFFVLLSWALKIAVVGLVIYLVIRVVSPDTAGRIRERFGR